MCGIAGIVSRNSDRLADQVQQMCDLIAHRGPDGQGVEVWPGVALGHRRLAIVDLSAAGHQPMSRDGRFTIVYNGEVYNHHELRAELEALGHRFKSHTDTEVILAAYAQWGEDCLHRFNGMWAFLILDHERRTLFAARDRFGVKPLYYWRLPDGAVAFGSEIKQFTCLPGWQARLNAQRAYDFLNWGVSDHTEETLFAGVLQLRGGQCLTLALDETAAVTASLPVRQWYRLQASSWQGGYTEAAAHFAALLDDAVRLRLRADVPVGSCLSGGLDSSSIVGLMNRQLRDQGASDRQKTFSACAHERRFDERPHMESVIALTGVDARFVYPAHEDLFPSLDRLVWHQDEPFGSTSIFAQWKVFELAAQSGVKVMLDGQGADEQLAGYMFFFGPLFAGLFRRGRWLALWREARAARRVHGMSPLQVVKHLVNILAPEGLRDRLREQAGYGALRPGWLSLTGADVAYEDPFARRGARTSSLEALCRSQLESTNLQMLLHWEDRDSMAHSVEARVPFLDYRIAEFLIGSPDDWKLKDGVTKRILRDAVRGVVPESVRMRMDKMGFVTPEEVWMRQEDPARFRALLVQAVADSGGVLNAQSLQVFDDMVAGRTAFSFLPWRMICFGAWMRLYHVSV